MIGIPSALCKRRISAQSSTEITLQECRKGVKIHPTLWGQYSHVVDKLATRYGLPLSAVEQRALSQLPDVAFGEVGSVHIALEAKAVMTKHVSSLPRLHDELAASEQCVHGASEHALAIAFVQINASATFAPSPSNRFTIDAQHPVVVRRNTQPKSVTRTLEKLGQLKRRSTVHESGFDGIGVAVVDFENQGGPVHLVNTSPAPASGTSFHYETMIIRMAGQYDSRFAGV